MARRGRFPRPIGLLALLLLICGASGWLWQERAPLRRARQAYSDSRWSETLTICRDYLRRHPKNAEALRLAGQSAARVGLLHEADRLLTQANGLLPDELRTHGEVLLKLREWDRANVIFETLAQLDPADLSTRMTLVALSIQRGRYNQAVAYARNALEQAAGTSQEAHCEYLLGNAYLAREDTAEAAAHYIRALEKQRPDLARLPISTEKLRLEVIDHLLSASRIDEAREQFAMLPANEPVDVEQLYQLGRLRMFTNDSAGAAEEWRRVLTRQPDHFGALFHLGKYYFDEGDTEQALSKLQRAVQLNRESAPAHFLLYHAYTQAGDDRAGTMLKRFRELNALDEQERLETLLIRGSPDHRDTQWFLAKRAIKVGDIHTAKIFLNRALKIDPDFEPAKEALAKIELQSRK